MPSTTEITELPPNEAAEVLDVSRTFVTKLLDEGQMPYRMVGSHRLIPYADVLANRDAQRVRSRVAKDELYRLDQELGLTDLEPVAETIRPGVTGGR